MTTREHGTPTSGAPPLPLHAGPEPGTFRVAIGPDHVYFDHHRVRGRALLPGVACLEFALRGAAAEHPDAPVHAVADAAWLRPVLADEVGDGLDLTLRRAGDMVEYTVALDGRSCATGALLLAAPDPLPTVSLEVRDRVGENTRSCLPRGEVYAEFAVMGIDYRRYFQRIAYVQRHEQLSLAWLSNSDGTPLELTNLLDCAFQAGMAISIGEHRDSLMPFAMGRMLFHRPLDLPRAAVFVVTEKLSPFRTRFTVFDENYRPLVSVIDLGVRAAS